jgi:alpha-mannosidase
LDPVWQWQWEEGCSEALATFRNAAQLLEEHDDLIFNHNEAVLYQWVQKYDPILFQKIQDLVKRRRWFISGGWYLQPDVNMPGIEALIRQILIGQDYFKKYFDTQPRVAYNFDSFGHSSGLPQLLSLAGYKMYIHMRPQNAELKLPSDLYRWQGVDGSEILTLRIGIGLYHTERDNIEQRLAQGVELALKLNRDVPVFWGLGNHGGGATRQDLKIIDSFIQSEKPVKIIHSTPDFLYESLRQAGKQAPVVSDELQRVFTGCYTSLSRLKRRARESLGQLVQTEAIRATSWWVTGQKYPDNELVENWKNHLFNDFHDILPGSCIENAEKDALDTYGAISHSLRQLRLAGVHALNKGPEKNVYIPVILLNSNPALKQCPVEFECMFDYRPPWKGKWYMHLLNMAGKKIVCQEEQPEALLPFNRWRRKICFMADLSSIGTVRYQLQVSEKSGKKKSFNPQLKYNLNPQLGLIDQLYAINEKQCLSGPLLQPVVIEDEGDSWGTDCWNYRKETGKFVLQDGSITTIEEGPIRKKIESVFTHNNSKIVMHTIAYSSWPVLEFKLRVHWNEERKRLKLNIPTNFHKSEIYSEIPGGAIYRNSDGQEHVHGRWCLVEQNIDGEDTAFALINDGQHGIDFLDGEIGLSVLRSAAYCHEQGYQLTKVPSVKYMDQGVHEIALLVTAGQSKMIFNLLNGLADWLSAPPVAYPHLPFGSNVKNNVLEDNKNGDFFSLLEIDPNNIRLLALKKSEMGDALIMRMMETIGKDTKAIINFYEPAVQINLVFKRFEIKTIRMEKNGHWQEVGLIDET